MRKKSEITVQDATLFPATFLTKNKFSKNRLDNGQFCTKREAEIIKRYELKMNYQKERDRRKIESLLNLGADISKLTKRYRNETERL